MNLGKHHNLDNPDRFSQTFARENPPQQSGGSCNLDRMPSALHAASCSTEVHVRGVQHQSGHPGGAGAGDQLGFLFFLFDRAA